MYTHTSCRAGGANGGGGGRKAPQGARPRHPPNRPPRTMQASEVPEWETDFDLLSTKIADIVEELDDELKGCR